ncbi:uncharacterized protein B0H64DRAFT_355754 [Chaetomium fimeti]|uniref:Ysc84 actin-binding domain-containing protein n=1 Tax=Chaetomium fimeti TaxID=1854472 RepID=A0AAE0LWT1_9PEZI|nr:hypothetical protein B0H64DRAFT_355754 [Chaetomium fimeti]
MSSNEKQPPVGPAGQQGQQQYFPPPPPGPPPAQTAQAHPQGSQPPKHTNETPLPDYNIPAYKPANPQFAPPPLGADDDLYNASPTNEQPPKWGHHQAHGSEGETKKKSNRLSAFGEAFTNKVAGPVNALANKFGSEGFLPESLDKECEKAARILRGFCKDGVYTDVVPPTAPASAATATPATADKPPPSPSGKPKKSRVLLTIPSKVIARAQGLAIFTAVRVGFQAAGSSGSGILVARLADGSWSPPSGIQITSIGAGFVAGVDIYDCVIVINTREALDMFTKMRLSLGSDLAVTAGPFGAGGALDWGMPAGGGDSSKKQAAKDTAAGETKPNPNAPRPLSADNTHFQTAPVPEHQQGMTEEEEDDGKGKGKGKDGGRRASPFRDALRKPVYSYVKSRGFYAGVQIDGTVIAARETANARFYGRAVPVERILKGEVPAAQAAQAGTWPGGARGLFEVLRGAEAGKPAQGQTAQGQPGLWQGGRPASAGSGGHGAAFGAAAGTGGAPAGTWVPPPGAGTQGSVQGVTAGVRDLGVGGSSTSGPPPGTTPATSGAAAKAAEAAADAARAQEPVEQPPPSYSEPHGAPDDLPPAYVEDERYRHTGGDSKTGLH